MGSVKFSEKVGRYYEVSMRTAAGVAASAPAVAASVTAATFGMGITRIRLALTSAAASTFGLYYAAPSTPSVAGTFPGNPIDGNTVDLNTSLNSLVSNGWTAAPVKSVIYLAPLRSVSFAGNVGEFVLWEWPEDNPLLLRTGGAVIRSVAVFNDAVGVSAGFVIDFRWREILTG
jgi:hypothetical protein